MFEEGYDPETVALLEQALQEACARAATRVQINDGLRTMLAAALIEGTRHGMREREELVLFSLRAIPSFRTPIAPAHGRE